MQPIIVDCYWVDFYILTMFSNYGLPIIRANIKPSFVEKCYLEEDSKKDEETQWSRLSRFAGKVWKIVSSVSMMSLHDSQGQLHHPHPHNYRWPEQIPVIDSNISRDNLEPRHKIQMIQRADELPSDPDDQLLPNVRDSVWIETQMIQVIQPVVLTITTSTSSSQFFLPSS